MQIKLMVFLLTLTNTGSQNGPGSHPIFIIFLTVSKLNKKQMFLSVAILRRYPLRPAPWYHPTPVRARVEKATSVTELCVATLGSRVPISVRHKRFPPCLHGSNHFGSSLFWLKPFLSVVILAQAILAQTPTERAHLC